MELAKFAGLAKNELSMIEVAYAILEETGDVYDFTELLVIIQDFLGIDETQLEERMARFYTDLNIDGRFISIGENRWGLRAWYPIDSIDEEIVSTIDDDDLPRRSRRKSKRKMNAFAEGEDIIDYNDDDPEDLDVYDESEEDFEDEDEDEDDDEVEEIILDAPSEDDDVEDSNEELGVYARDLSELGDDDLDLDAEEEAFESGLDEVDDDLDDDLEDFEEAADKLEDEDFED